MNMPMEWKKRFVGREGNFFFSCQQMSLCVAQGWPPSTEIRTSSRESPEKKASCLSKEFLHARVLEGRELLQLTQMASTLFT